MSEHPTQDRPPEEKQPETPKRRRPLTDEERAQLRHRREMELKRRQQILRNGTPEEKEALFAKTMANHKAYEEKVEVKPVTFRQKWNNYWYHYKLHTFAAVIAVALVSFFVYDMVTKEEYDISIMAITNTMNTVMEYPEDQLAEWSDCIEDINGDGKQNVSIEYVIMNPVQRKAEAEAFEEETQESGAVSEDTANSIGDSSSTAGGDSATAEDPNTVMAYTVRYQASLGEVMNNVYLVDQENYDELIANDVTFVDLSQYSDDPNIDGDKYYVKDNPLFSEFPNKDALMLVVRDVYTSSKRDKESYIQQFEADLEVVKNLIAAGE